MSRVPRAAPFVTSTKDAFTAPRVGRLLPVGGVTSQEVSRTAGKTEGVFTTGTPKLAKSATGHAKPVSTGNHTAACLAPKT